MGVLIPGIPDQDDQLVTIDQANAIAATIGSLGGGVKSIYLNPYSGPYESPVSGAAALYEFTFASGPTNLSAGLIWADMRSSPYTWPAMLALGLNSQLIASNLTPVAIPSPIVLPGPSTAPQAPPANPGNPGPGWVQTPFGWSKKP